MTVCVLYFVSASNCVVRWATPVHDGQWIEFFNSLQGLPSNAQAR
jgi:hypothetical protein